MLTLLSLEEWFHFSYRYSHCIFSFQQCQSRIFLNLTAFIVEISMQPTVSTQKWLILEEYVVAVSESAQNHKKMPTNNYKKNCKKDTSLPNIYMSYTRPNCSLDVFKSPRYRMLPYRQLRKKISTFWADLKKTKNKNKTWTVNKKVTFYSTHPSKSKMCHECWVWDVMALPLPVQTKWIVAAYYAHLHVRQILSPHSLESFQAKPGNM